MQSILVWELECVEEDICKIERRITLQRRRIEQHNCRGRVPVISLDFLNTLKQTLSLFHQRRKRILRDWA